MKRNHDQLMGLSPRALQAFVAVADLRSFRAASDQLVMDASTVSKLVQRLETALGAQLLIRSTRRVDLTSQGEAALGPAQEVLATLSTLADVVTPPQAE